MQARNVGGPWSSVTELPFAVATPFYKTARFYALSFLTLSTVVWLIWNQRVRRLRREYTAVLAERARVGREVHDTLLQGMVGVALQLGVVADTIEGESHPVRALVDRAREALERSIRETRTSIWEFRSTFLDGRSNLPTAVRRMAEGLVSGTEMQFELTLAGTPVRSARGVEHQLLRIAQEAISNAIRHSRGSRIKVELDYGLETLVMRIIDNGRGFEANTLQSETSTRWGLRIMRERASEISGQFRILSGQSGTAIETIVQLLGHPRHA